MLRRSPSSKSRRGAIVMLLTVMTPFLLIPIAGLAIDATIIHIVQTKLQAAVDASALGAGRLLGTSANITEIAGEFFKANFLPVPNAPGFWGATLPNPDTNPNITYVAGIANTVTVNAHANVPTLFMRIFGYTSAQVSAAGQATRRDARVMFVIDRSGSMNYTTDGSGNLQPITKVLSQVQSLIQIFTPGVDEVGLVVFDSSAVVGYPSTTSYSPTVGVVNSPGPGGPDTCFWDTTQPNGNPSYGLTAGGTCGTTTTPDAVYQTGKVVAQGGTGMAEALTLAYIELQKAHLRDLKANGSDLRTNAILLFTDGAPTAMSVFANDPNHGGPWLLSSSNCTNYNAGATSPIQFWASVGGSPPFTSMGVTNDQLANLQVTSTYSPLWWMQWPYQTGQSHGQPYPEGRTQTIPGNESTACATNLGGFTGFSQIPAADKWGNSSSANTDAGHPGYHDSCFMNGSGGCSTSNYYYASTKGDLQLTGTCSGNPCAQSPYNWGLAMWNNVDNAALNIRTDANYAVRGESAPMTTQILTIGYAGDGGTDAGLLKRVANDPNDSSSPYDLPSSWTSQPKGKFCLATDLTTLQGCMNVMASILLHLTK